MPYDNSLRFFSDLERPKYNQFFNHVIIKIGEKKSADLDWRIFPILALAKIRRTDVYNDPRIIFALVPSTAARSIEWCCLPALMTGRVFNF